MMLSVYHNSYHWIKIIIILTIFTLGRFDIFQLILHLQREEHEQHRDIIKKGLLPAYSFIKSTEERVNELILFGSSSDSGSRPLISIYSPWKFPLGPISYSSVISYPKTFMNSFSMPLPKWAVI